MKLHPKQIETVIALPGPDRYNHFIKQVTDSEKAWGLYNGGWALAATSNGEQVFPLWPAEEYAKLCAQNEWAGYEPSVISLDDLMEDLLPQFEIDGILPGIFYTPNNNGVTPEISQLVEDLRQELTLYE